MYLVSRSVLLLIIVSCSTYALPWETWEDSKLLAQLNSSSQSLLRSSYCPYNCRYDRSSSGDNRFLRMENEEAVIFEELNPGAISRIWMTSGVGGSSVNLDKNVRIKFYFDGELLPRIDIPLPQLFDNSTPPFLSPLTANRVNSSGGNISYVPINYAQSLKVTLTNAVDYKLWYQFNFHRMTQAADIKTFNLANTYTDLIDMFNQSGDIWQPSESLYIDSVILTANNSKTLYSSDQAGWVKSIKMTIDENYYDDVELILSFDNQIHSQLSLREFFAIGNNSGVITQSLFLGLNKQGALYSNFPMPYYKNMSVNLVQNNINLNDTMVNFEIGIDHQIPNQDMGIFSTQSHNTCPSIPFVDSVLLNTQSKGKWVGLFTETSSINSLSKQYLEGDERIYIDGDIHPTHYGTGVEDFYNGGFYFDQGNFSSPLHGSSYSFNISETQSMTSAYRFMLTDGIDFQQSLLAQVENGPFGDLEMCTHSIAYYYSKPTHFQTIDELDLNSQSSIDDHHYSTEFEQQCQSLLATFLDQPATELLSQSCQIDAGGMMFKFNHNIIGKNFRIRRLFDNSQIDQVADIYINDSYQGMFSYVPEKSMAYVPSIPDRKWQQESIDLEIDYYGDINVRIVPRFDSGVFTASKFELLGEILTDVIFTNSFE